MDFKKVAITGHTRGIGKALYDYFLSTGHEVIGFSKSTGFDISNNEVVNAIIEQTIDCDLFINNAYHRMQQTNIAKLWQKTHWNSKHFIVNMSSVAGDPLMNTPVTMPWITQYGEEKSSLNETSYNINYSESKCNSIVIMPGMVNTNFANPYDTDEHNGIELYNKIIKSNSMIQVEEIVDTVVMVLKLINDRNFISSVTVTNNCMQAL